MPDNRTTFSDKLEKLRKELEAKIDLAVVFERGYAEHVYAVTVGSNKLEFTIRTMKGVPDRGVRPVDVVPIIKKNGEELPEEERLKMLTGCVSELGTYIINVYLVLSDVIMEKIGSASPDFS